MTAADAGLSVEQRAALLLQLRHAHVRSVDVMRAIEIVPRAHFAPHRFRDLALRDVALPIGCGQTMPSAADLGRALEALDVRPEHRALEVGAGSGYGAAVLARLARDVVSYERFESLAIEAGRRLAALPVENVLVLFGDGLAPSRALGFFDRIVLHVALEEAPQALCDLLAPEGVLVYGRLQEPQSRGRRAARLVRLERRDGGWRETDFGQARLSPALPGAALAL